MNIFTMFKPFSVHHRSVKLQYLISILMLVLPLVACESQPNLTTMEENPVTEAPFQAVLPPILVPQMRMYFSPTEGFKYQSNESLPKIALEDLYGMWDVNMFQLEFRPDGTYVLSWKIDELNELRKEFGTFFLDYNVITFHPKWYQVDKDAPDFEQYKECTVGGSYAYTASYEDEDKHFLHLVLKSPDSCAFRIYKWYAYPFWQLIEE